MWKSFNIVFFLIVSFSLQTREYNTLLDFNDFETLSNINYLGPINSSTPEDPDPFEFYMEWICFDSEDIHIECFDYVYDESNVFKVPGLKAEIGDIEYQFGGLLEQYLNCDQVLPLWDQLIAKSQQSCLMVVETPNGNDEIYTYDIYQVKTDVGFWKTGYFR